MAINKPFSLNSERLCRFYAKELNLYGGRIRVGNFDISACRRDIENYLGNRERVIRKQFEDRLTKAAKEKLLSSQELNWIKEDEHCCHWAWGFLKESTPSTIGLSAIDATRLNINMGSVFSDLVGTEIPSDKEQRFHQIVTFLDELPDGIEQARFVHSVIKKHWASEPSLGSKKDALKWLEKGNREQCDWAWDYINGSEIPCGAYNPLTSKDRFYCIKVAYSLWNVHPDRKTLFIQGFRRAWSQKKFREQQSSKDILNTYIDKEAKIKLKKMSAIRNVKMNELIEILVNEEYERIRKTTM